MSTQPGIFVLSLDTEVAWGTFDHGGLQRYATHFNQIRPIVHKLVEILDCYDIPATWAFVGHLLLDECKRSADGIIHPEVLRPRYRWYPHDWHHRDPGTDLHRDPWWYGPDLLEAVLNARVHHEIGTHTFSHVVVGDPACTADIFRSQLAACKEAHAKFGLDMDSIVYPRNKVAFLDTLLEMGITVYRGPEQRWYTTLGPRTVKILRMIYRVIPFTPPTYPLGKLAGGTPVNVPASLFFSPRDGFRRAIPIWSRVQQARRGLARAAHRGDLFHMWFHPFNMGSDPQLFTALEEILRYASELRSLGKLDVLTMYQSAERIRQVGISETDSHPH